MRVRRRYLILLVALLVVGLGIALPLVLRLVHQRRALAEWEKMPPYSEGRFTAGSSGPRSHSRQFWEVLEAFDLDGRPAEDLIAVLGQPDRVRSVDWYFMPVPDEERGVIVRWPIPLAKGSRFYNAPDGLQKILEGKVYQWKRDEYYWPNPFVQER